MITSEEVKIGIGYYNTNSLDDSDYLKMGHDITRGIFLTAQVMTHRFRIYIQEYLNTKKKYLNTRNIRNFKESNAI